MATADTVAKEASEKLPLCVIVLGMAGSGKTTLVQVSWQKNQP